MNEAGRQYPLDRNLIGTNVRNARLNEGLSQTELARRSGVDLASVYRVEKGKPTHKRTLEKIATGLMILFEDLLIEKQTQNEQKPYAIHRASDAMWFANADHRKNRPPDNFEAIQNPSERFRIGKLGFVPLFMSPPLIIPQNGPGVVLLEAFGVVSGPFNADFYEDGALLVLRGRATGKVREEAFELDEGDWIAFKTADLKQFGVAETHEVATLLWIGATRIKRQSRKSSKQRPGPTSN